MEEVDGAYCSTGPMSTSLSLVGRPSPERRRSALLIRATDPFLFWFNSTLVVLWILLLSLVTVGYVFLFNRVALPTKTRGCECYVITFYGTTPRAKNPKPSVRP
jgi:hypothetical protein